VIKLRKEKLLWKAEQIRRMTTIFTQNDNFVNPGFFFEFTQLYILQLFSFELELNHVIQESTEVN
jgi:hypothetical protein